MEEACGRPMVHTEYKGISKKVISMLAVFVRQTSQDGQKGP